MTSALFAYMGIELVGVTFGEAKNPRKTVPATIRRTFARILSKSLVLSQLLEEDSRRTLLTLSALPSFRCLVFYIGSVFGASRARAPPGIGTFPS